MNFKETLTLLNQIKLLYKKGKREEANQLVTALLVEQANEEAKRYILQIVQDIKKNAKEINQEEARIVEYAPSEVSVNYGKYYDNARYQELLSYCQLAY